ncbi:TMEM175 family protein [Micromonospora parathelypteridis]|uniref:TMEM175 family protein n=1 Tax=Micromonospora parathelypteridis TaxID=1839617 RepID=UPI001E582465|nr:TMEM175 family protein [Micromonospora parathelypteridis]
MAFSDGVFAIAVTLLVLEIQPPQDFGHLLRGLGALWPSYLAYALSFLLIGQVWVNHHVMFDRVRHVDREVLFFNTLLLMVIASLPFSTSLTRRRTTRGAGTTHVGCRLRRHTLDGRSPLQRHLGSPSSRQTAGSWPRSDRRPCDRPPIRARAGLDRLRHPRRRVRTDRRRRHHRRLPTRLLPTHPR